MFLFLLRAEGKCRFTLALPATWCVTLTYTEKILGLPKEKFRLHKEDPQKLDICISAIQIFSNDVDNEMFTVDMQYNLGIASLHFPDELANSSTSLPSL